MSWMRGSAVGGRRASRILLLILLCACQRSPEQWAAAGEAALRAYKLEEAEQDFQRALDIDPPLPQALYGMGWIYSTRRDTAQARVFYERCIDAAPHYYGGYKGMGSLHLAMGFYDQAEASLKKAIALKPDEAASHGSLGYVYLVTRRLDLAEQEFQTALELEPKRGEVHYLLAELRARQGQLDAALKELEQGEGKPIEEVKFRLLNEQLRGQLLLQKALEGLADGEQPPPDEVKRRSGLLEQADKALDAALALSFVEEKQRLFQLKDKVRAARERLNGPPPI
jgi:tetratricopeptide (TPR) repeat protein